MTNEPDTDSFSEAETEARREAALKRMLATPHKKQADTKSSGMLKRGRPAKR